MDGKVTNLDGKVRTVREAKSKTINSADSLVVTHPTTNVPAQGLSTAERTGSPVLLPDSEKQARNELACRCFRGAAARARLL
jgi:hypothetical protein